MPFENIVGKGENADFLLFPECFLPFQNQISIVHLRLFCRLKMLWISTSLGYFRLVNS